MKEENGEVQTGGKKCMREISWCLAIPSVSAPSLKYAGNGTGEIA